MGVQLPSILDGIQGADALTVTRDALAVTAVVVGVRLLWMAAVPPLLHSEMTPPERIAIAWSGMRGGVSLAAALAIPVAFPQRDRVIFIAYAVILVTPVLPGLTLAPL